MTYGVPYSFVPGTKAKANEVNANFNDILKKLETTNTRIDTTNKNLEETNKSVNTSKTENNDKFTKIDEELKTKANTNDLDGKWTEKTVVLANGIRMTLHSTYTFDLSKHLPSEDGVYETYINIIYESTPESNNYFQSLIETDLIVTESSRLATHYASTNYILPVGSSKSITLSVPTGPASPRLIYFMLRAYRKVK